MSRSTKNEDSQRQKALVVAPTPYYIEKGSALRVHAMVKRLNEAGYTVDVVCYNRGEDPTLTDMRLIRAGIQELVNIEAGPSGTDLINDVFLLIKALQRVAAEEYDLIQGEDVEGIGMVLLAALFSDAEVVYDLHNPLTETLTINEIPCPARISRAIEGILYRHSDRVLANWNKWKEAIQSRHGVDQVELVYDELPEEKVSVDLPADQYITYVGNFKHYQGVDILLSAFENVASEVDVDLLLVGEPTQEIQRTIASLKISNRVHLIGRYNIETSNYIIANAVASILPRRSGDQPSTKLIHYTMHDTPIIATKLDCNRELSRFDNEVLWADPRPDAIEERLVEVCCDK
jgi:glycosyltransferase involved in cell wall biosynthesis